MPLPPTEFPEGSSREVWDAYFDKFTPKPQVVADAILRLHRRKQYEHVIAGIESALVHGQSQPWMYDVLALTMQIAHRPNAEVVRALLSRVDFTAMNVPNMLYSAAHLSRFGADEVALRMYRQASRIEPTRPEPYVMGLKVAQRVKDHEAIGWAAFGILTTVWGKDFQQLHRSAENAVLQAQQELRAAGRNDEAAKLDTTLSEARKRDLVLKLTWSGGGDLDLIVEEPDGSVCSHANPTSRGGGVLVHDGYGPDQKNCYEEYVCALGVPGNYRVRIKHVWGEIVGKRARLTLVRYSGSEKSTTRTVIVPIERNDKVIRLSLAAGRRKQLLPEQTPDVTRIRTAPVRRELGRLNQKSRRATRRFEESRRRAAVNRPGANPNVGFQPIIGLVSDGISMGAMAVVSGDRRYVRLSVQPAITGVNDVLTFIFQSTQ